MENNPLISVIVPVYNVENYLDRCVESIVNQTYTNLEIILVDDGSPDNCPMMCNDWEKRDSRIKVIHKENGGVSSARNRGLDVAKGDYIAFVDSDDYLEKEAIKIFFYSISCNDYDICICNVNNVNHNGEIIDSTEYGRCELFREEILPTFLEATVFDSYSVWDKLYKTDLIRKNNLLFDEEKRLGEDYSFNYLCFKESTKIIAITDALYNYFQGHEGSITDGMTYDKAMRWTNTKQFLPYEYSNSTTYPIVLKKYSSELLCCIRELLRSGNEKLIFECYDDICKEVKLYSKDFLKLNISKANKLSIILICINKSLFKKIYQICRLFSVYF